MDLTDDESKLLARVREEKQHGFAEITLTIHDHYISDLTVTRKERIKLPPAKLREVTDGTK